LPARKRLFAVFDVVFQQFFGSDADKVRAENMAFEGADSPMRIDRYASETGRRMARICRIPSPGMDLRACAMTADRQPPRRPGIDLAQATTP